MLSCGAVCRSRSSRAIASRAPTFEEGIIRIEVCAILGISGISAARGQNEPDFKNPRIGSILMISRSGYARGCSW